MAITLDQIFVEIKFISCFLMNPFSLVLVNSMTDGDKGITEYRKGYFIESIYLFGKSIGKGFAPAQVTLAYNLDQSAQNIVAFHWHQQTANNNHPAGLWSAQSIRC